MKHFFFSALLVASAITTFGQSQLKLPALSPGAKISQDFSVSNIEISYSRPSMRGRKIFGDVVAYGKPWRTGANSPTKIKIGEDLEIAGYKVKAGEYALYTIPNRDKWEVILSNSTANWNGNGFPAENDVARFTVRTSTMQEVYQTFTINITDITYTTCKIEIAWDRTKVVIPVVARNADNIEVSIDKAINHPPAVPYFQVANYYYESNRKMETAKMYVDKAVDMDPKAYYMWYLKARIEKKLGNTDAAIAAAKKSIEVAKGTPAEDEYLHNNTKLLDEIKRERPHRQEMDRP
jgi:tetratricopeptide (TPR) repeat protein